MHYTPTHGSWLNQAEIEIGLFSRQCFGRRRIPDMAMLRRESRAWNRHMNRARVRINWAFDREAARRKFHYKRNYFTPVVDLVPRRNALGVVNDQEADLYSSPFQLQP